MALKSTQHSVASSETILNSLAPLSHVDFSFTADNVPNAEILLPSLRQAGYTLETAVGDLVDNPLDADADVIVIALDKIGSDWSLAVADNGTGMEVPILDQMMRLGSKADHDLATDLGAFGLGSTTASLALGRLQHVITRTSSSNFLSAAADLDEVVRAQKFVKHLGEAQPAEVELFGLAFQRWGLDVPETGTVVKVGKCDKIGRSQLAPAVEAIKKYIGQTYRYFIWAGKKFYVNGELVEAIDPLERENRETQLLLEDAIEYTFPKGHHREGEIEKIGMLLVQLPDWGGDQANKMHGYNMERQGLYVMRNRREVVPHTTMGLWQRHNSTNRFRGEILFPAALDHDLGVSFLKSAWDIKPSQSLRDKLDQFVSPYRRQAAKAYEKSGASTEDQIPHDEAAKVIRQRSPFLRKPQTKIEARQPRVPDSLNIKEDGDPKRTRCPKEPRTQVALADLAEFRVLDLGSHAPFYEADLVGKKVLVTYNGQHPFYQKFMLQQRENRSVIAAMDYLVYSLATAELMAATEDTYKFIERLREDASFNLRQLLAT
jgi:hypothetical protein